MRDHIDMSQYAHARALHILEDIGVEPDDARYVMKRLYDLGYTVVERDPSPGGTSPPAHPAKTARKAHRQAYLDQARAEIAQAQAARAAELEAALARQQAVEEAERAAQQRALAVQRVLAGM